MLKERIVNEIEKSVLKNWDQPALSDIGGQPISYAALGRKLLIWHGVFKEIDIKPGDKIALVGKNSASWAEIYLSVITYGAIAVPILSDFSPENIHHIVTHSDAKLLFSADSVLENLEIAKMAHLNAIFSLGDGSLQHYSNVDLPVKLAKLQISLTNKFSQAGPDRFSLPDIHPDNIACIVYTSGTTGFSKGVMLSHNSLSANIIYAQNNMPLKAGDRVLSFLPLAHSYACAFEFLFPVSIGCHVTFLNKLPTPQVLLKAFEEVKPRLIFLVPLLIEKIFKNKIKPALEKPTMQVAVKIPVVKNLIINKIKKKLVDLFGGNFITVIIGGAALNPEVEVFLKKCGFPFTVGYGMTECGPLISYAPWNEIKKHSVGRPINYLEVRIKTDEVNPEIGEILVRGENVMKGYYKNPEATQEAIDKEGWLHTGDLGIIDEDGFIFIKGRCKNMILGPSGQNIYPEDIEARLNVMPLVQESVVLENEGKLIALVYPDIENMDESKIEEEDLTKKMDEIKAEVNKELPNFSQLSQIRIYPEEFEKTPTKKIKRYLYKLQ